jgi:histidinol-phosphate/aromatic aminotransferase/cobyric acid decarboxylase-like protein
VAAAYEKAADRAWKDSGPTLSKAIHALSDTDALAEYVEKVRADERERCAKIADKITRELRDGETSEASQ